MNGFWILKTSQVGDKVLDYQSTKVNINTLPAFMKAPCVSLNLTDTPLFLIERESDEDVFGTRTDGRYRLSLISPTRQVKVFVLYLDYNFLLDYKHPNSGIDFILDEVKTEPIIKHYLQKNNAYFNSLQIVAYASEKEFYRDCAITLGKFSRL